MIQNDGVEKVRTAQQTVSVANRRVADVFFKDSYNFCGVKITEHDLIKSIVSATQKQYSPRNPHSMTMLLCSIELIRKLKMAFNEEM